MAEYKEYTLQGIPDSEIKIDYNLIFICMPFKSTLYKLLERINILNRFDKINMLFNKIIPNKFDKIYEMINGKVIEGGGLVNEYNNKYRTEYRCERSDISYEAGRIMASIWNRIREANIIIFDLTGKNENVMYELGLAHAIGKYTILISSDKLKILPFDISQENCILYKNSKKGLDNLKDKLEEAINKSRYIIDFKNITSPTQQGWLSVQGTFVGDTLKVKRDEVLQKNVLYTDTDPEKGRFKDRYKWTVDYAIMVRPSKTNVIFCVKAIGNQRFGIYFRIRVQQNPNLDFWIIYTYKNDDDKNNIKISTDRMLRYDPDWANEIVYDLEILEKRDWSSWVEFKRNLKEDFSRAINEFRDNLDKHDFNLDDFDFHQVTGIRIHGPCCLEFIEFK